MSAQSATQSASVPAPPGHSVAVRRLGTIGAGAGLLFAVMSAWEAAAGLGGASGAAAAVNQAGFAVAIAGYVSLGVGLVLARPGGDRPLARVFPLLLTVAWAALLAAMALESLTSLDENSDPLDPIGGLLQGVALIGLAVSVVAARRWAGWRRWVPVALAVVFVGVLIPNILEIAVGTWVEVVWALGYAALGLAVVVEARADTRH